MLLLNCNVPQPAWEAWAKHFAPSLQPFYLTDSLVSQLDFQPRWTRSEFSALDYPLSLTDTFALYQVRAEAQWVMLLDEATFKHFPLSQQASLLHEQVELKRGAMYTAREWATELPAVEARMVCAAALDDTFVWWPSLWKALSPGSQRQILSQVVIRDRLEHQGSHITEADWQTIHAVLPGARNLAGSFVAESGANCLSTVVAAFGRVELAEVWLHGAPFERWLNDRFVPADKQDVLGTVLVWHDGQRRVQHAAVSLGQGVVLQKDAQCWFAPRQVLPLQQVLERFHDASWTVSCFRPRAGGGASG